MKVTYLQESTPLAPGTLLTHEELLTLPPGTLFTMKDTSWTDTFDSQYEYWMEESTIYWRHKGDKSISHSSNWYHDVKGDTMEYMIL